MVAAAAVTALSVTACGQGAGDELPAEPAAGAWRSWTHAPARTEVPPPPPAGSRAETAELAELRAMAGKRTPQQERQVRLWDREPAVGPWIELAMKLVSARPKDPPAASRAYAS